MDRMKKTRVVKMRVTEDDYRLIKSNQEIYGYGTLTRFLTAVATGRDGGAPPRASARPRATPRERTEDDLRRRVAGVVERYNSVYGAMAALVPQLSSRGERRRFLIQMARLDQETRRLVALFREIKAASDGPGGDGGGTAET